MAATTAASFYNTLKNMSLTGVTNGNEPPLSVQRVKLPYKYVHSLTRSSGPLRAKATGGQRSLAAIVVVLVEVTSQDTHANRWSDTIAMVDTLDAGLAALTDRRLSWTITANPDYGEAYFAVVAEVSTEENVI